MNSDRKLKILNDLFIIATDLPLIARARIAAVIVKRNKVIAYGFNQYKSHTLQARYARNSKSIDLHAEIDAIKNALKKISVEELKSCDIYIARAKKIPNESKYISGLVKPCTGCQAAIEAFGLRNVYYTDEGDIEIYKKD